MSHEQRHSAEHTELPVLILKHLLFLVNIMHGEAESERSLLRKQWNRSVPLVPKA